MIKKWLCKHFGHKTKIVKSIKTTKYYDEYLCKFEYIGTHCQCKRCNTIILRKVG